MKQSLTKKLTLSLLFLALLGGGLVYWQIAQGVNRTWDGGGVDGTCGGAGTANNWSCAANWSGDTAPTTSDVAIFDGTSTKNATINANISVAGISINAGYSGTITQSSTFTVTVGSSNYSQAAGTFTGGSGDITVNGTYALSGGTFTSTTGTLAIGGNFTHTAGGTFSHNNGTVNLGGGANGAFTADVATSETFNNLTINPYAPQTYTIASGDTLIALGTFTHSGGFLMTGTIEARGDVVVGASSHGSTALLSFTGGNNQTYTDQGGDEVDGDITVNKSAGTVTLASNADWNATSQDVTITSGTLASSSYNITTNNFTVNGGTFTGGSGTVTTSGPMLVSSGTFTGGSGNITVNNIFTLSGGTFTSTSGTFTLNRNGGVAYGTETVFTVSGGTFNHNNGTLSFYLSAGTAGDMTFIANVSTTLTLYNIIADTFSSGGFGYRAFSTDSGDTIIAANNFTHTRGRLVGTWEVQGNVIIGASAGGGTGTLTMTGTGSKTYTYSAGGNGPYLRVNSASISVSANAGTTALNASSFSLMSGTFTAPSGTFTILGNGGVIYGTETVFTVSGGTFNHNNGTLSFYLSAAIAGDTTFNADVVTTLTLYNVIADAFEPGGGFGYRAFSTASGDTIIAANNFTHTRGRLDGTWQVQGNMVIGASAGGGAATVSFTGGNTQIYTDSGGDEPDGNITINKTANSVTLASNADWNAASQTLTITAGTLLQPSSYAVATGAVTVGASGIWVNNGTGAVTLGGNVSNAGLIDFRTGNTCGGSDTIALHSSSNGVQRTWSGAGTTTMRDIEVKDQGGSITAYSSTNTSGNGWTFNANCSFPVQPKAGVSGKVNILGKMNVQ